MPRIRKIRFIRAEVIDYQMAKDAWEILHTYPNNNLVKEFRRKYNDDPEDIFREIDRWRFTGYFERIYKVYSSGLSRSRSEPVKVKPDSKRWIFNGVLYEIQGVYNDEQSKLLVLEEFDKERRLFEKLKSKFVSPSDTAESFSRPRISEPVRVEVWRRDGGKCARCGSRENLEYDHIIPISKGGSNTARNIELLCEKHNRSKSNNIV